MNTFQKRVSMRVLGIHATIIFLVAIVPFMRGCFAPKPKEIITFIEFGAPAPEVNIQEIPQLPAPEPPAPEPPPDRIPELVKKPTPVKKPVPVKKKPTPIKKPESKWKPTKVDPTKSKRIKATPQKPTVSAAEIKKELAGITKSPTKATGNPSQFNAYDAQVFRIFYGAWTRPGVPGARPAKVRISVSKNGRITGRVLTQRSGDTSFDQSVMAAVNKVSTLPKPPAGYPDNFVVRFSIID